MATTYAVAGKFQQGHGSDDFVQYLNVAGQVLYFIDSSGSVQTSFGPRPSGAFANLVNFTDNGGSTSGVMTGGAAQKTYVLNIAVNRPTGSGATGDSNDAGIKVSYNNYAVNDANFIIRGVNVGITARSPGVLGILESANFGAQQKSGSTAATVRGLTVHPENYGSVTGEIGGIDVMFHNEGASATLEYGIRIRNVDQSNVEVTPPTAILIPTNAGNTKGWTYGIDLNGATIVAADIRLHTGAQIFSGSTDPNTALTGANGSVYIRTGTSNKSTTIYINTNGSTAWAPIVSA
jgi:hypothetical protein